MHANFIRARITWVLLRDHLRLFEFTCNDSAEAFCAMDKYQKIRKIGEGAFGNAFLVKEKDKDRQMVMKEINMTKVISSARHQFYSPVSSTVSRHFGLRTLRTQDISAQSDWCRSVRTVRHQCRSVFWILRHWCRTVSSLDVDNTC